MKYTKYTCMKRNLHDRFLMDKILISTRQIQETNKQKRTINIDVQEWLDTKTGELFYIENIENFIDIYALPKNSNIFVNKDFVEVTNNPLFDIKNIINGSLQITNTYIEGADGTGKTTTVNGLATRGIILIDRCVENITKVMNQDDKIFIVNKVKAFLENNPSVKVIFLYVSDPAEHKKRIYSRDTISDFDKTAFILQEKYLYTYNALKHFDNLFLVDTCNRLPKDIQDQCAQIAISNKNDLCK